MNPRKPVLIELDGAPQADPGAAPPPPDDHMHGDPADMGRAMQGAFTLARARPPLWARMGWAAALALLTLMLSLAAWDFVTGLLTRIPVLGYVAATLLALVTLAVLMLSAREWAGFRRLARIDALRARAVAARTAESRRDALGVTEALDQIYAPRPELRWARATLTAQAPDQMEASGLLDLAETTLMAPLDASALREVQAGARQVALLTAMLPLALVDVLAALLINLRMIRRIAEIYGGRAGTLGNLRLLRGVITHLLATGAVAVGEDMIGSVASGGVISKLSRRFGEGVVNGALTTRLGIAAIEVCRPLPFHTLPRPRTSAVLSRALTGLFERS